MMEFTPSSIYNRGVSRLKQNPDWSPILNQSVITALLKTESEMASELARYAEYLYKESKYDTAQNDSSILAMANFLGYYPPRKVSATGVITVSIDPKTHLVGKTISSEVFNKVKNNDSTANVSWIANPYSAITITTDSIIKDNKGRQFFPTSNVTLNQSSNTVDVEVIQGIRKTARLPIASIRELSTISKLNSYRYVPIRIENCEDASTILSRKFLKVYVVHNNSTRVEYRIVDSLMLSESIDRDVEFYNDMYDSSLFYIKFNNSSYRGSVLDISSNSTISAIEVEYIESLGANSNVDDLYETFVVSNCMQGNSLYSGKLYGINTSYIKGGRDEEDIPSIKESTPKAYTKSYTIGTTETYAKAILNTSFTLETSKKPITPKKVIVYGGNYTKNNITFPVTYVSFISDNLDDLTSSSLNSNLSSEIEDSLNYYLSRLKSPQDVLKFAMPNYVSIALGVNCIIDSDSRSEGIDSIENSIKDYIDTEWGPSSDSIDFGNSFFSSKLEKDIMNKFTMVKSIDMEMEAIHKCDWGTATFVNKTSDATANIVRTLRIPFQFSPVFLGSKNNKGFKDIRVGASYLMRIDIMYKNPKGMGGVTFHKSIFIDSEGADNTKSSSFYIVHDTRNCWTSEGDNELNILQDSSYSSLGASQRLKTSYQINYTQKVYNDNEYKELKQDITSGLITTQNSSSSLGAIDDYIVYFSGNYDSSALSIGNGWFEIGMDDIYAVLQYFATMSSDIDLQNSLRNCSLNLLKCGTLTEKSKVFQAFKTVLSKYIDIYVAMRPIDNNLRLSTLGLSEAKKSVNMRSILYIDSKDEESTNNTVTDKKSRMISVDCEYEG